MMRRRVAAGLLSLLLLPSLVTAATEPSPADQCITAMHERLSHTQRIYRMRLVGRKPAAALPAGSTLYDADGHAWIKTETGWQSEHARGTTKNDQQMDADAERDELQPEPLTYRGIFEARGVPTSFLVPLLQLTYEGLDCRVRAECMAVQESLTGGEPEEDGTYLAAPDGCVEIPIPVTEACQTASEQQQTSSAGGGIRDLPSADAVGRMCLQAAGRLLSWEAEMLKLLTAYDAAARTVRQVGGILDAVQEQLRAVLVSPLRDVTSLLLRLQLPCIVSQCG